MTCVHVLLGLLERKLQIATRDIGIIFCNSLLFFSDWATTPQRTRTRQQPDELDIARDDISTPGGAPRPDGISRTGGTTRTDDSHVTNW